MPADSFSCFRSGSCSYRVEVYFHGFQYWTETNVHVDANQVRTFYPYLSIL